MAEVSPLDNLANNIVAGINKVSEATTNKAQYDKSYKCTIIGVNKRFTKDIPAEKQTELITKYGVPDEVEGDSYYFFKINGIYYCLQSNTDFKLYDEVNVRVPNNNWNKMFIETGKGGETIIEADTYTYRLIPSLWRGSYPYTYTINATWASATLHPIIDVVLSSEVYTAQVERAQWSLVSDAYCGNKVLIFRCLGVKPSAELNVIVKVI